MSKAPNEKRERHRLIVTLFLGIVAGVALSFGASQLWLQYHLTQLQGKGSYAVGAQMGRNFINGKVDVIPSAVCAGMTDQLADKKKLSTEESRSGIEFLHKRAAARMKAESPPQPSGVSRSQLEGAGAFVQSRHGFRYQSESNLPEDAIERQLEREQLGTSQAPKSVRLRLSFVSTINRDQPGTPEANGEKREVQIKPKSSQLVQFVRYLSVLNSARVQFDDLEPVKELWTAAGLPNIENSPPFTWIFEVELISQ